MKPETAARYSYVFALVANAICFLINFTITAGYLIAGQWRAAGLQSLVIPIPAILIWMVHYNDQRRLQLREAMAVEIAIRHQMLQHIKDGTGTATLDDDPVRH
jgi:hypothetical protein